MSGFIHTIKLRPDVYLFRWRRRKPAPALRTSARSGCWLQALHCSRL